MLSTARTAVEMIREAVTWTTLLARRMLGSSANL
jgi:hypothetical protein